MVGTRPTMMAAAFQIFPLGCPGYHGQAHPQPSPELPVACCLPVSTARVGSPAVGGDAACPVCVQHHPPAESIHCVCLNALRSLASQ